MNTFFKHFDTNVVNFVHKVLDDAEILHFVHHITDYSVFIYVDEEYYQGAISLLSEHSFLKHVETNIDEDNDRWIELFF